MDMKTKLKTMYQIRCYTDGSIYSKSMSNKLREREAATRLVKRLKKMGHQAFAEKFVIRVPA